MSASYAPGIENTWVVVLAGGDGTRVGALLRGPDGTPVPKQYFAFGERGTMCAWALARAAALVPRERILVVVAEHHDEWWREALAELPSENILVQPENLGTGVGILLALSRVSALVRYRKARILCLPSDHYVSAERVLRKTLVRTLESTGDERLVLVGITPEWADPEYGWIVPEGCATRPLARVARFVEKPDSSTLEELRRAGALINSFIFAAEVGALLRAFEATAPRITKALGIHMTVQAGSRSGSGDLRSVYRQLHSVDFSRDVLMSLPERLGLVVAPSCGWSDLGTPARLMHFLEGAPAAQVADRRIAAGRPVARRAPHRFERAELTCAPPGAD